MARTNHGREKFERKLFEAPYVVPSAEVASKFSAANVSPERAKQIDEWLEQEISKIPDKPRRQA